MKRTMSFIPYAAPRMLLFLTLAVFAGVSDARACGNSGYTSVYDNGTTIWATGTSVEDLYGFPIAIEVRLTSPSLRWSSDSVGFDGATTSTIGTSTSLLIADDDGTWWGNSDHYMLAYGSWNATTSSAAQRTIACRYPSGETSSAYSNSATYPYVVGFLADLAGGTGFDGRMVQESITMTLADSCKAMFPNSTYPQFVLTGSPVSWTVGSLYRFTDPDGAYIGARSNGYGLDPIGFTDVAAVRWYAAQLANGPGGYCGIQANQSMYMRCRNSSGGQYYTPWPNQLNYQIHPAEVRMWRASALAYRPVP